MSNRISGSLQCGSVLISLNEGMLAGVEWFLQIIDNLTSIMFQKLARPWHPETTEDRHKKVYDKNTTITLQTYYDKWHLIEFYLLSKFVSEGKCLVQILIKLPDYVIPSNQTMTYINLHQKQALNLNKVL